MTADDYDRLRAVTQQKLDDIASPGRAELVSAPGHAISLGLYGQFEVSQLRQFVVWLEHLQKVKP